MDNVDAVYELPAKQPQDDPGGCSRWPEAYLAEAARKHRKRQLETNE